jgi:hypothetical protein
MEGGPRRAAAAPARPTTQGVCVFLYDLNEFFKLSGALSYQLSAAGTGRERILATIFGERAVAPEDMETLLAVLEYLDKAYGEKHRRLGPKAVLHPLRAAALLVRAHDGVVLLDLLAELLHDKFEDIVAEDFDPEAWSALEGEFQSLLKRIDPKSEWFLMERLDHLTRRREGETYYQYIGRLLERAQETPELVRVKLADRLDNTLDMRVDFRDPLDGVSCYATLFQILYCRRFPGLTPDAPHAPQVPLDGARRLYELFKNAVVLTLVRQKHTLGGDDTARKLFRAIAEAGLREAQRILVHIFTYHYREVSAQRRLLLEAMEYCWAGGVDGVTVGGAANRLDGLFLDRFDSTSSEARRRQLEELYQDKELMISAATAFMVIFLNFLSDESYFVRGVSTDGIRPAHWL